MTQVCNTCRFWGGYGEPGRQGSDQDCRRHAPAVLHGTVSDTFTTRKAIRAFPSWPQMPYDGWCGDHESAVCSCVESIDQPWPWPDIGPGKVGLFYPLSGYTAQKDCPMCAGTGLAKREGQ